MAQGYICTRGHPAASARSLELIGRIRLGSRKHNEGGMTTFDKREDGFEKKFAHDEELLFKASARRNKLLGQWAA
jgi:hypothetical protein